MGEKVIVRQNNQFGTEILALDPSRSRRPPVPPGWRRSSTDALRDVVGGSGLCTAIVLHTYAQHHGVGLREVELRLKYDRVFADDCEECEGIEEYREQIAEEIVLTGDLTPQDRKRLFAVSKHCPIHKMLTGGIEVQSRLAEDL